MSESKVLSDKKAEKWNVMSESEALTDKKVREVGCNVRERGSHGQKGKRSGM
jgi:hypothetical protein